MNDITALTFSDVMEHLDDKQMNSMLNVMHLYHLDIRTPLIEWFNRRPINRIEETPDTPDNEPDVDPLVQVLDHIMETETPRTLWDYLQETDYADDLPTTIDSFDDLRTYITQDPHNRYYV